MYICTYFVDIYIYIYIPRAARYLESRSPAVAPTCHICMNNRTTGSTYLLPYRSSYLPSVQVYTYRKYTTAHQRICESHKLEKRPAYRLYRVWRDPRDQQPAWLREWRIFRSPNNKIPELIHFRYIYLHISEPFCSYSTYSVRTYLVPEDDITYLFNW